VKLKYFFILFLSFFINDVFAKRVALVIGNDGYQYVSKLQKAKNDADKIAADAIAKAAAEKTAADSYELL
jgi:hypothetical protein